MFNTYPGHDPNNYSGGGIWIIDTTVSSHLVTAHGKQVKERDSKVLQEGPKCSVGGLRSQGARDVLAELCGRGLGTGEQAAERQWRPRSGICLARFPVSRVEKAPHTVSLLFPKDK